MRNEERRGHDGEQLRKARSQGQSQITAANKLQLRLRLFAQRTINANVDVQERCRDSSMDSIAAIH